MNTKLLTKFFIILAMLTFLFSCEDDDDDSNDKGDEATVADTVIDYGNGTIGVFAQGLTWKKCAQGQAEITCSGTAQGFEFCSTNDNSCNGGTNTGNLEVNQVYDTCANEDLSGRSWRVPTESELLYLAINLKNYPNFFSINGFENGNEGIGF